ncbi:hypothetical protein [Sphingomonas sp. ABOLE]|uniref:hypothetical protein n=1 Tax=Sphingomonas sp. ABOLE TaxID=1985878 RepID=UPI000F7D80CC|nr:hypothetical protein [Sphingomonas sp. ABOLE]
MTLVFWFCLIGFALIGVIFGAVRLSAWSDGERAKIVAKHEAKMRSMHAIEGFNPELLYEGQQQGVALALDPEARKFAIGLPNAATRVYKFEQLIAVEVVRNGETITTTRGTIDTQGAALGTLLAGPVGGLLAGAKTHSVTTTETRTTALSLKLVLNDLHLPTAHVVFFLAGGPGRGENSFAMHEGLKALDEWYGRFKTILVNLERRVGAADREFEFVQTEPLPEPEQKGWMARTFSP